MQDGRTRALTRSESGGVGHSFIDHNRVTLVVVNGQVVLLADLKHGDTLELGEHRFQLVVEPADSDPTPYVLPES